MDVSLDQVLAQYRQECGSSEWPAASAFADMIIPALPLRLTAAMTGEDLARFLSDRYRFLAAGSPDRIVVKVHNPPPGPGGWVTVDTVVESLTRDRPFLLDTLRDHLRREGITARLAIHPVLMVERKDGRIARVADGVTDGPKESYIFMHIERIEDASRLERLQAELTDVLTAVQRMVDDYQSMRAIVRARKSEEGTRIFPEGSTDSWKDEVRQFLDWLLDGNFVFMGYQRLRVSAATRMSDEPQLLGIARADSGMAKLRGQVEREVARVVTEGKGTEGCVFVTKLATRSVLHRSDELECVGIREYSPDGTRSTALSAFVGLLTSRASFDRVTRIPLLRRRAADTLALLKLPVNSHSHKAAVSLLENLPKEEFYYFSAQDLRDLVGRLIQVQEDELAEVLLRPTEGGTRFSPVIVVPRANYSTELETRIRARLGQIFSTEEIRAYTCFAEGGQVRIHYYMNQVGRSPNEHELENAREELAALIESWEDRLMRALGQKHGEREGARLFQSLGRGLPDLYRTATRVETAVRDILALEQLRITGDLQVAINDATDERDTTEIRVATLTPLALSALVPMLENFGLKVGKELPASVPLPDGRLASLSALWVRDARGRPVREEHQRVALAEGLRQVLQGRIEDDPLNRLILAANLDWWIANLFQLYRNYLSQIAPGLESEQVTTALVENPGPVRALFNYFEEKFNPIDTRTGCDRDPSGVGCEFLTNLDSVDSIAQDRVLRRIYNLMQATVRTNFFKTPGDVFYISVKMESGRIEGLAPPRPLFEIYVHSVGMEGCHLRNGAVARGGIRWSDRPTDFRSEILGLMKTQVVKNTVIVPTGSKGGFVTKRTLADPRANAEEGKRQYSILMRGLLDLTDNRTKEGVVHPEGIVVHDKEDPYLVVAADKGTANLSDVANEIAQTYGFWLGDAFASGGSKGYNHKAMGITAKGAWECAKRHFLDLGVDPMHQPITVVGIGDMSGDVFGNGLILSRQMRLIAAFNHVHIFLDPDPPQGDAAFEERLRLFKMARSTWRDYKTALISEGGGVYDRSAKVIALGVEARKALATPREKVNGEELIKLILQAPVDLIWNGGIGTYVKASTETHADVGDRVNDPVRVDAPEVRAKVIGEGGNLGLTMLARIELDLAGGRVNTDFIDNSAGVDLSDHEVNLKILLAGLLASGALPDLAARDALMAQVASEVEALVLADNANQSLAISADRERSKTDAELFIDLAHALEEERGFNRALEKIGPDEDLSRHALTGHGIPRPTICVLFAQAKLHVFDRIIASTLPDSPALADHLVNYFPASLHAKYREVFAGHPLRREILATQVTNLIVNCGGAGFFTRLGRETGATPDAIALTWLLVSDLLSVAPLRARLRALDTQKVAADLQVRAMVALEESVGKMVKNLLINPAGKMLTLARAPRLARKVAGLKRALPNAIGGAITDLEMEVAAYEAAGFPADLIREILLLEHLRPAPYLLATARKTNVPLKQVLRTHLMVGQRLGFDDVLASLESVGPKNAWEKTFHDHLYHRLAYHQGRITKKVLELRWERENLQDSFDAFTARNRETCVQLEKRLADLRLTRPVANAIPSWAFKELYARLN